MKTPVYYCAPCVTRVVDILLVNKLNPKKLADVKKLLNTHFGQDWKDEENLSWYANLLADDKNGDDMEVLEEETEQTNNREDEDCSCLDFETNIHV